MQMVLNVKTKMGKVMSARKYLFLFMLTGGVLLTEARGNTASVDLESEADQAALSSSIVQLAGSTRSSFGFRTGGRHGHGYSFGYYGRHRGRHYRHQHKAHGYYYRYPYRYKQYYRPYYRGYRHRGRYYRRRYCD